MRLVVLVMVVVVVVVVVVFGVLDVDFSFILSRVVIIYGARYVCSKKNLISCSVFGCFLPFYFDTIPLSYIITAVILILSRSYIYIFSLWMFRIN